MSRLEWNTFVAKRIINDVDMKLPTPDPIILWELCWDYYCGKITNIQFKQAVRELQK